jgi:hypothetical protein
MCPKHSERIRDSADAAPGPRRSVAQISAGTLPWHSHFLKLWFIHDIRRERRRLREFLAAGTPVPTVEVLVVAPALHASAGIDAAQDGGSELGRRPASAAEKRRKTCSSESAAMSL